DPRRAVLRQGKAAGERRPLGSRDRPRPRPRGALPMSGMCPITPSPPFRGEREGPIAGASAMRQLNRRKLCLRRDGRWEGEVGIGQRPRIPHLTSTLSAPGGGEGEVAPLMVLLHPHQTKPAFPAKAGIHASTVSDAARWVPAFAGNAVSGNGR